MIDFQRIAPKDHPTNINRDTQVKKTSHVGPINAIPPVLWLQAAIITLGTFATTLSSTILSATFPAVANGFGVTDASVQWIATACLMALAAGVPVSTWAAEQFGATQLWLYALILFSVLLAVYALSPNVEVLFTARIMRGLIGGLLMPVGQTILGLVIGRERLGRIIDTIGVAIIIAPLLRMSLGAVLLQICGWRVLLFINVPLSLCAWLAGQELFPRPTIKNDKPFSLDQIGLILILCSLPLLMEGIKGVSLNSGENNGNIILFSVGALSIDLLIYRSFRIDSPLLHLSLFRHRGFTLLALLMTTGGAVNFDGQFLLPLYFRDVCHEALADVSLLFTPQLIGSATGFPAAGYFSNRLGPHVVLIVGGLLSALATWPLAMINGGSSYPLADNTLTIRGSGLAFATMPAIAAGLAMAGTRHVSDATPIPNILQYVGAMADAALVTAYCVRLTHTQDSLAAFQHAGWMLISDAILLALSAFFMVNHQGSSTQEEAR